MVAKPEIHHAKILVVDDQIANVTLLEKILANIGYQQVTSTLDPTTVCALHQEHHFDLILLDLQMPVMDGFEVMQALKEVEPESYTPVLVITAQPGEKLRALQAGAKDFVSKPFELVELQTRIANMLEVRLLYKRLADYNVILEQTVVERTLQLQQSEARFKSFTKLSSDWYWEQDANGNFVSAEGPVFEMLGIHHVSDDGVSIKAAGDLEQRPDDASDDLNDDAWNQAEYAQLHDKIESRTPFLNYVYRRILNNGSQQFLQVSGEPIFDENGRFTGYRGIGMELNDRRRAHTESAYLRMALNSVEQAILVFDGESKTLLDANHAACDLFAIAHQDIDNFDLQHFGLSNLHARSEEFSHLIDTNGLLRENAQLRIRSGEHGPICIQWRAFSCDVEKSIAPEKWVIVAAMSEIESITVFDGLD
ncbi:response regulator [Undibacterium sp. Ji22W]|uniref:response regulator n=1 Tax=Undibacterium sp. Ji22W TaxID=3413038 RepID=UPI003BF0FC8C